MMLNQGQFTTFDREGYLFLPDCFAEEEVAFLRSEAEAIYATDRKAVWREKSGAPEQPSPLTPTARLSAASPRIHV